MIHDFLSFYIVVSHNVSSGKRKHLSGRLRATVSMVTPLKSSMQWDITSLVQTVNLIRAKTSITPIGLYIFFFFKTWFGMSEQVWIDETNYNFAFQISK